MTVTEVLKKLEPLGSPENVAGMERFGIVTTKAFGITAPVLKQFAREIKKQAKDRHALALALWDTGIYDARVVAYLIDDPKKVTKEQMESWVRDFDNWAIVDGTCGHLFVELRLHTRRRSSGRREGRSSRSARHFRWSHSWLFMTRRRTMGSSLRFCPSSKVILMTTEILSGRL